MHGSAAELGLANGGCYVLEAVCACMDDTGQSPAGSDTVETSAEAIARALQPLANARVAFLPWPRKSIFTHVVEPRALNHDRR